MEQAVINLLLASAGVTSLVGTRIDPQARPQGVKGTSLVVRRIDGAPEYAADGVTGLENGRIEVSAYGETYNAAKAAGDAAKAALSAVRDVTTGGVDVLYITVVFERDSRETGAGQSEYLFRRQIDVDIWIGV